MVYLAFMLTFLTKFQNWTSTKYEESLLLTAIYFLIARKKATNAKKNKKIENMFKN